MLYNLILIVFEIVLDNLTVLNNRKLNDGDMMQFQSFLFVHIIFLNFDELQESLYALLLLLRRELSPHKVGMSGALPRTLSQDLLSLMQIFFEK